MYDLIIKITDDGLRRTDTAHWSCNAKSEHLHSSLELQGVPKVIVQRFGLIARPVII